MKGWFYTCTAFFFCNCIEVIVMKSSVKKKGIFKIFWFSFPVCYQQCPARVLQMYSTRERSNSFVRQLFCIFAYVCIFISKMKIRGWLVHLLPSLLVECLFYQNDSHWKRNKKKKILFRKFLLIKKQKRRLFSDLVEKKGLAL